MSTTLNADNYVVFTLADTLYAIPSNDVERMEMVEHVTPVPNSLPFVDGIVFSRGRVVPAINLRRRFGFTAIEYNIQSRLIIVANENRIVGLIVDSAREFVSIATEAVQPAPDVVNGTSGRYLRGVANVNNRVFLILDIAGILDASVV
ncbi:chemotaxis protein CheW [bacterium]|nr:chemotaxis protein CheW [bacterium]